MRLLPLSALIVVSFTVGCRDDTRPPTEPASEPALAAAASAPLAFRQVSGGGAHTCGVTTDDRAFCWGSNDSKLGNGLVPDSPTPVEVRGGLRFRSLSAGLSHACGVTTDDRAFCWGSNSWGQIGDGTGERTLRRFVPVAVLGGLAFREVSAGYHHTCDRTTANLVYCWGHNLAGQLGDGTTTDRLTAIP